VSFSQQDPTRQTCSHPSHPFPVSYLCAGEGEKLHFCMDTQDLAPSRYLCLLWKVPPLRHTFILPATSTTYVQHQVLLPKVALTANILASIARGNHHTLQGAAVGGGAFEMVSPLLSLRILMLPWVWARAVAMAVAMASCQGSPLWRT